MKEINLGRILLEHRRKHNLTQEELASYMGVSKAAVSKWETGTAYPDILLLPRLASFFNISIDTLMGYEPQMSPEDIRNLYRKLSGEFSSLPFDTVIQHCQDIIRKYYSCFPLLFQIGTLLLNHCTLTADQEKREQILEQAAGLFVRVRTESDDVRLGNYALNMEAYCQLLLNRPRNVLELLDESRLLQPDSPAVLLAGAWQMTGNPQKAKTLLQTEIYKTLIALFGLFPSYVNLCLDDQKNFDQTCRYILAVSDLFSLDTLHPGVLLPCYLAMAQGMLFFQRQEEALLMLEKYTDLAAGDIYPLRLHGNSYFDLLDQWIDESIDLGDYPPRDESVIRRSMTEGLTKNPAFAVFETNPRFQELIRRLKANERKHS